MAAIDKMYVKNYYEYDDLLRWSIIYYPKLLTYFYDIHLTQKEFYDMLYNYVKNFKNQVRIELGKIGDDPTISLSEAAKRIKCYYKENINYDASDEQCHTEADHILKSAKKTDLEIESLFSYPVLNTPFEVDNYLKWHCPLPCIRRYLQNQCGVNPKWNWLYKLFWKGKKEYM